MRALLALALVASSADLAAAHSHLQAAKFDELAFDLPAEAPLSPTQTTEAAKLLAQGAQGAHKANDAVMALQLAQMAHRRDPHQTDALRLLVELSMSDEAYTAADGYLGDLLKQKPDEPQTLLLRARLGAAESDWDQVQAATTALLAHKKLPGPIKADAEALSRTAAEHLAPQLKELATSKALEERLREAAARAAMDRTLAFNEASQHDSDIIIYGTSWCGFCKKARAFFTSRHIPFVDKDIEKDADAAEELTRKAQAQGIRPGGVPVIDVHGKLVQGFNAAQLEEMLANGGP